MFFQVYQRVWTPISEKRKFYVVSDNMLVCSLSAMRMNPNLLYKLLTLPRQRCFNYYHSAFCPINLNIHFPSFSVYTHVHCMGYHAQVASVKSLQKPCKPYLHCIHFSKVQWFCYNLTVVTGMMIIKSMLTKVVSCFPPHKIISQQCDVCATGL